uniref:Uncharacterized protein n=1 Tax=Anguilla anguilla TaxID=7936 RepID=A0A0E9P8P4_ANGAN
MLSTLAGQYECN